MFEGTTRPKLLDLFCGAGGCSVGYSRAGFEVVGVDNRPMPNYPFEFHQADALEFCREFGPEFDAIHASPPCQLYSRMTGSRESTRNEHPDLVGPCRDLLQSIHLPWVIENVGGSPLARGATMLCGFMFGLPLYRHRWFESEWISFRPEHRRHKIPASKAGHWKPGTIISVAGHASPIEKAREAMGIDWMTRDQLAQAIPPAYTEYIGKQLIRACQKGGEDV